MSGLNHPVVGTCSVAMATKMPWNDAGYRPPQVCTACRMGGSHGALDRTIVSQTGVRGHCTPHVISRKRELASSSPKLQQGTEDSQYKGFIEV